MPPRATLSKPKNLRVYLGSTIFFIYIVISLVIAGVLILLSIGFSFKFRYWLSMGWIRSVMWMVKVCCGVDYEVEGLENLPKDRAAIVLSKHQSAWETLSLRLFLPTQTALLKQSLLWIPIGGWALATLRPIAINRQNQKEALKMLIDQGTACLNDGIWVVVFPEGTRTFPGEDTKFNAGGAMLAHKTGAPVVPLAHNAGEFWPRYSFFKYPGTIKVKIGPVISTENKKAKEINDEAEAWIKQAMASIAQENQN